MSYRICLKRLVAVEIDSSASNQHEFNAGLLRRELGLEGDPAKGEIDFLFYLTDDAAPLTAQEHYTLYDSRRGKPRSAEWRMYYTNRSVIEHAEAGDLLLILRPSASSTRLVAVVARRGTEVERALSQRLAGDSDAGIEGGRFVDSPSVDAETGLMLLRWLQMGDSAVTHPLVAPAWPPLPDSALVVHERPRRDLGDYDFAAHPLFASAVADHAMPSTADMAAAAQGIVTEIGITAHEPDDYIHNALEAETGLFTGIEKALGQRDLERLYAEVGLDFNAFVDLIQRYLQRRRVRRGQSLENHFRRILLDLEIPHTYQCKTEGGKTPDFIFPSGEDYHDPDFPDDRLRMVGCKTRVRERHSQWLDEATRIRLKYALCVDGQLRDNLLRNYEGSIHFFLPKPLLDVVYEGRHTRHLLGTVADLIHELRTASGNARSNSPLTDNEDIEP